MDNTGPWLKCKTPAVLFKKGRPMLWVLSSTSKILV
jgi:hypothetical protein